MTEPIEKESLLEEIIGYTRDSKLTRNVYIREYVLEKIRAAAKCGKSSFNLHSTFTIHSYAECSCNANCRHCSYGCITTTSNDIDKVAAYLSAKGFTVKHSGYGYDYTVFWMPEEDKQHEHR